MTLAVSLVHHASAATVAMGFAVMLVLSLVAAEEAEIRQAGARPER